MDDGMNRDFAARELQHHLLLRGSELIDRTLSWNCIKVCALRFVRGAIRSSHRSGYTEPSATLLLLLCDSSAIAIGIPAMAGSQNEMNR